MVVHVNRGNNCYENEGSVGNDFFGCTSGTGVCLILISLLKEFMSMYCVKL